MFPSSFEYMHGVTEIFSGVRYAITSFWTYQKEYGYAQHLLDWTN